MTEAAVAAVEDVPLEGRRRVGLYLGPTLFLVLLLAPLPLPPAAHKMAAVATLMTVFWITEAVPLPVTALLGPTLAAFLGVAKAREIYAPFADPVIFLFLGSFLIAEALHAQGLDHRLALWLLSLPGAASSPGRIRMTVGLVTALISMWISNTATAAMMLPVTLGIVRALRAAGGGMNPAGLLLVMGIAASMGGIGTPVGTPPNLVMMGFLQRATGERPSFLQFMGVGVPLAIALMLVTYFVVGRMLGSAGSGDAREWVRRERAALPAWGAGQTACIATFAFAIVLWVVPGLAEESLTAIAAAVLLFFWPIGGGRRALSWDDARRIEWGTLLLFGGGLSLGELMRNSGLSEVLGRGALAATGVESLWGLTAITLATTILLTEIASNTAAVTMLAPLVLAIAKELGVSVYPPMLALGFGASMGFMFPVGTPPNAIVYGTGLIPMTTMMKTGILVDILSFFVIFAGLRLLCPALGLI